MSTDPLTDGGLHVQLESHLPDYLVPGARTAIFCVGHCFARHARVESLRLLIDGVVHRPTATGMPRPDLYAWLAGSAEDPDGRSYRSGFWATLPLAAPAAGAVELVAEVRTDDGREHALALGTIPVGQTEPRRWEGPELRPGTIAVCLASFDPDPALLETQIESLRAQSDRRWVCVVSDGGSEPSRFAQLLELTQGDDRFVVSRAERRLGPYENFERALRLVPREVELVALCDQDDRWFPDKLSTLRAAIGPARLIYSDQRMVDGAGRVLRDSLWRGRRNDHRNLASLLVANAVPGAAMLFRRELLDLALPFPPLPGNPYHDHWLALVALASGELRFVDEPLFDWAQHAGAASRGAGGAPRGSWRGAYFGGYVLRRVQAQTLLARCAGELTPRKRRALEWFSAAEDSPGAFAWLAARPLRRLVGRDETLSGELPLVEGILWRWLVGLAARATRRPVRGRPDASSPEAPRFEQPRLRRWRSGA